MSNNIKYSLTSSANSIKSGNFNVAVNNTTTDLTGFYNGITPIIGGYTIYINKASNGPSIYAPKNDTELVQITNSLGGNVLTAAAALVWINSQSTMTVLNNNYPSIVTSGLVLNLDAGFVSSYPKTGTTWKDLSGGGNTGTLVNGVSYNSENGGSLVFDGVDDVVYLPFILDTSTNYTIDVFSKCNTMDSNVNNRQTIWSLTTTTSTGYQLLDLEIWGDGLTSFNGNGTSYAAPLALSYGPVSANTINCYTISKSGSNQSWYINGVLKGVVTQQYSAISQFFKLSSRSSGGPGAEQQWNGNNYSTKIYNRALSAAEILQNYYAGLQRLIPTNGLVLSLDAQNTNLYAVSTTTAYDISGNNNNGSLINGVQYVANGNGSWRFDGVDDSIIVTSKPTNYIPTSGNFTIIGWINRNSIITPLGDRESIFTNTGGADGFRFQIGSGGVLYSLIGGVGGAGYSEGSMGSGYNVADGNWHQVGVMFDRTGTLGSYKAYAIFDGIIIGNRDIASTNNVFTNQDAGISYACCSTYKGSVSTLSVYSNLLTATEITTIYNATKSRYGL